MFTLFKLFLFQNLKTRVSITFYEILIILSLSAFTNYKYPLLALLYISLLKNISMLNSPIRDNLNWLTTLPLSKRKIVILTYLTGVFNWVLTLLSFLVVTLVVVGLKEGLNSIQAIKALTTSILTIPSITQNNALKIGIGIIGFSLFHMSCLTLVNKNASPNSIAKGLKTSVFLVCGYLIAMSSSHFVLCTFIFSFFIISPCFLVARALCMSNRQRNQMIALSAVFSILLAGVLYQVAINETKTSPNKLASILFLGQLAPNNSQEDLAKLFETNLSFDDIYDLSSFYLNKYHDGKKINQSKDKFLQLNKAIAKRQTVYGVEEVTRLFDPSELGYEDLKSIFEKIATISQESASNDFLLYLLDSKISTQEIISLLTSNNSSMIRYGLIRSRYDRDPSLIPVVESNMAQYSDDLRLNALTTLSIFYGKYIGLDDWVKYRSKSSFGSHGNYFNTNCANFNLTKTGDLNESNIQLLNLCIRQKARKGEIFQLKNIESAGWIGLPLQSFQKRIVEEVFQIEGS